MSALLTIADLLSLEKYTLTRQDFRQQVMRLKKNRQVNLGEHIRLLFENQMTVRYQIQEMLRIEKIFEAAEIQEELDTYNPMIPTGLNLKATMMIEYNEVEDRKEALSKLIGVERSIYIRVGGHEKVYPICNEDLKRETEDKTSSVHFMRFEFTQAMVDEFCNDAKVSMGVEHDYYPQSIVLDQLTQDKLKQDFN
ncbi:DUF3501 family protein [Candidatus Thioglobus sp.]|uniref:DUF3501 family protein n=1 Tax=Candidatus Thioglobus sp. TaxID=2026721 RepID=UPI00175CBE1F|nr:DUF3501 family protein [Candidatus Thioglobus sp.]HIF47336.1 DUF3501 family protein [Candidatus Thioglobus sp.]